MQADNGVKQVLKVTNVVSFLGYLVRLLQFSWQNFLSATEILIPFMALKIVRCFSCRYAYYDL